MEPRLIMRESIPMLGKVHPLRIIHILNHIQVIGNGIVHVAVDLACMQARAGHIVTVVSGGGAFEELLTREGVQHIRIDQRRTLFNIVSALVKIRRTIKRFSPDIIHAHMITGLILAKYAFRKRRYRLLATVHNEFQKTATLMGIADHVIVVSEAVKTSMIQRGIPAKKIEVILNGCIGSPRLSIDTPHIHLQRPSIVTVSGMYYRKGILTLIQAFEIIAEKHPDAHLYLVGDGEDRKKLEQDTATLSSAKRIHFEGFQRQTKPYLDQTDIFVLVSEKDACPLVLIEARDSGCAIIGSAVDGIPELLDHGRAGRLIPARDPEKLATVLDDLLTHPEKAQELRLQAGKNVEKFHLTRASEETLACYRRMLSE